MKKTAVIGLGSPLRADDGIGLRVIAELEQRAGDFPDVDFLDMGTGGLSVLYELAGRERVIFVDCTLMGAEPGAWQRFTPDEVRPAGVAIRYSAHEGDLLNILRLARDMGECPQHVVIIGIEPAETGDQMEISPQLLARLGEYVEAVAAELNHPMERSPRA